MKTRTLAATFLCLVAFPTISLAQERGQVGLTMGLPAAAGLIWHATDRIAVRPEITFSQVTSKAEASPPNASVETTERSLGVGASLLWYFTSSGDVRPYISPRLIYNRSTSEDSRSTPEPDDDDDAIGSLLVSGSLGVQYTPSRRIGFFGEIGIGREHTERTRSFPEITVTTSTTSWSTRSAVGVNFYF